MVVPQLLPDDFDELVGNAVEVFWRSRDNNAVETQSGTRGAVISGKNMDGFLTLVELVAEYCGLDKAQVQYDGHNAVTLPGFFRPTKKWDALVFHDDRLIAVFEFKSHMGSLGNNQNNRSEEALGNAVDFFKAYEEGAFEKNQQHESDPRPPFLGYLMLCEDSENASRPVRVCESNFPVFDGFGDASYAERYKILCERLMKEDLYNVASLLLTPRDQGVTGSCRSLSDATGARALYKAFAAHILTITTR